MKNQVDYFKKVIKILEDLKQEYPDIEISKHYSLATDCGSFLTDKELYLALQRHKGELDMHSTLSDTDTEKILKDTDELFKEVDWEEDIDGEYEMGIDPYED